MSKQDKDKPLIDFLLRAKKCTYAAKGVKAAPSRPNSHDYEYAEGDLVYRDTYLGNKNFVGQEAICKDNTPCWAMNYAGRVVGEGFSGDFLKEALMHVTEELPFRGPPEYTNGVYTYKCSVDGGFLWFSGVEEICCDGVKVYECVFHGGGVG